MSEHDMDDFGIRVDPIHRRITLMCPAPVVTFQNLEDFGVFVDMLQGWIPVLQGHVEKSEEPEMHQNYAEEALHDWQSLLNDSEHRSGEEENTTLPTQKNRAEDR